MLIHKLEILSPGIVCNTFDASGNDPLWYTLYSGIRGEWQWFKWMPIPQELVDTLVAYGCDPAITEKLKDIFPIQILADHPNHPPARALLAPFSIPGYPTFLLYPAP